MGLWVRWWPSFHPWVLGSLGQCFSSGQTFSEGQYFSPAALGALFQPLGLWVCGSWEQCFSSGQNFSTGQYFSPAPLGAIFQPLSLKVRGSMFQFRSSFQHRPVAPLSKYSYGKVRFSCSMFLTLMSQFLMWELNLFLYLFILAHRHFSAGCVKYTIKI